MDKVIVSFSGARRGNLEKHSKNDRGIGTESILEAFILLSIWDQGVEVVWPSVRKSEGIRSNIRPNTQKESDPYCI